jgi:hypothetical protein
MIAKWLGLIEAGRLSSGGGSPLGDATVWNSITDWTDFGSIPGPLRNGDLVPVTDLLPGFGIAQYNGSDWELKQALFPTKADLEAFPELVGTGAIAIVGTGVETDPIYYSDGTTWFRTPDGTRYIYPNELDWASLPTEDTIKADDEAVVASLGLGNAYGRAVYDGTDWLLSRAWFDSVADMTAFPELKSVGALASVEASASDDENAVRYQWNGSAWARTAALTAGYAWTLTESQALTGADPSGIGALKDGDFGIYTPANGAPIVLRFKEACPVAVGAGGVPRPVWMIPEAYAGTPEVVAYLTGSETGVLATTLAAQGWTVTTTGSGAGQGVVSLNDGYVRCQTASSVGGGTAQVATTTTWLGSQNFSVQGLLRGSVGGSDPYVGLLQVNNNDIQYTFMRGNLSGAFRHFVLTGTPPTLTWTTVDSLNSLPSPTLNLDGTTPWFFQAVGRTLAENAETRINGELYGSMRRNLDTAGTGSAMNLALFANGGGSGTASTLDSKTLTILTY